MSGRLPRRVTSTGSSRGSTPTAVTPGPAHSRAPAAGHLRPRGAADDQRPRGDGGWRRGGGRIVFGHHRSRSGRWVESHQTMLFGHREAFVVKLAADGSFAWGGTFASQSIDAGGDAGGVAIDGAGDVFVAGYYAGEVDLDPSAGTALHTSRSSGSAAVAGALVKLTPAGKPSWVQSMEDSGGACPPPARSPWPLMARSGRGIQGGWCPTRFQHRFLWPDGSPRGYWGGSGRRFIAAGLNGSVYVGGSAWGFPDFDPGPGVARRLVAHHFYRRLHRKAGIRREVPLGSDDPGGGILSVAGTPDGGVIGLGYLGCPLSSSRS